MTTPAAVISVEPKTHLDKAASDAALKAASGAATKTVAGVVKQAALVPTIAGASPTKAEWDALLAAFKTAGLMSAT